MLGALARSLFGTANDRIVKGFDKPVAKINALEPEFSKLSDEALRGKTVEFRERLAKGETLDDLLVEAFATVREAAKRTLGQRPFDVQLKGGMVLHQGKIAEMKTGEGKTLVATLPVYLNALEGKGVHVVTVNDYLAKRDSEWMGRIYGFLGLTTGVIVHDMTDEQRAEAYRCDVTYGTNNEIGFDYLRDNMKYRVDAMVQRPFNYAIVDEVDSILIDEARTPLIISGPAEDSSELYRRVDTVIPRLAATDYEKDEKARQVTFTEIGVESVEEILRGDGLLPEGISLYAPTQVTVLHHVTQALRAHKLFTLDVDYMVRDGQVVIIDEFTGRAMSGRRYSEGLHQALEAKEHVEIQRENQTLASITFQNLFRMYPKLAGMTGTAMTEAAEFGEIYRLEVVEIPTNVPVTRKDADDEIYRTLGDKTRAIVKLIKECQARNQPMLVGTVSIEKSEELSEALKQAGITHSVLNARFHEQEAQIVAQAGRPGTITIATNMAGRGTDIQLGGNVEMLVRQSEPEITARIADESRAQGRDRAGRGGDPRRRRARPRDRAQGRRPVRGRHRAPREPAHRQPAARPLRPPGRSGRVALLPVARRRPDAHLRQQQGARLGAEEGHGRRRGPDPSLAQQGARDGAGQGRGAQLRDPQEPAALRRRHEQPAQGDLQGAHRADGDRGRLGHRGRHAPRRGRRAWWRAPFPKASMPSNGRWPSSRTRSGASSASTCRSTNGPRKKASPRTASRSGSTMPPTGCSPRRWRSTGRRSGARSRRAS